MSCQSECLSVRGEYVPRGSGHSATCVDRPQPAVCNACGNDVLTNVCRTCEPEQTSRTCEPPYSDGHLDGYADAVNRKPQDARGRWTRWHAKRPESAWPDYERGYNASYEQVAKADRERNAIGGAL